MCDCNSIEMSKSTDETELARINEVVHDDGTNQVVPQVKNSKNLVVKS